MAPIIGREEIRTYVAGAFRTSWADRDALVREANNKWAPAAVISALMGLPNRYYRSVDDLQGQLGH